VSFRDILNDLQQYLEYRLDEGTVGVELSRAVVAGLGEAPGNVPSSGVVRPATTPQPQPPSAGKQAPRPKAEELDVIAESVASCTKCALHKTRTRAVPGQGSSSSEILFVGEAPGFEEDRQGLAFVGAAGKLLTKMIQAMGYTREQVFIGNILKCRPPGNRPPTPDEMETCLPYLKNQIAALQPKVIVALGATAVKGLLDVKIGITKLRGTWMSFEGIDLMPTFHPAYLLRNPPAKREAWEDLKAVLERLGRKPPPVKRG